MMNKICISIGDIDGIGIRILLKLFKAKKLKILFYLQIRIFFLNFYKKLKFQ